MKRFLSILLAVMLIASTAVVAVSAADNASTATVTLYNLKGESVTQTYAVGDSFTAVMYLNASEICSACNVEDDDDFGIGSIEGMQSYSSDILTLTDSYQESDGLVLADTMFPILNSANVVANAGELTDEEDNPVGTIYYNASVPGFSGVKFNSDDSVVILTNFTVKAAGEATITNRMDILAVSDYDLTRIYDNGVQKKDNFSNVISLSEPTIPIETGFTVSGTITSFLSDTETTTVQLLQGDEVKYSAEVTEYTAASKGFTSAYSIADVEAGDYTLRVAKKSHATRDYAITVSGDLVQDAKIHLMGDITGDGQITNIDYTRAKAHARGGSQLKEYEVKVADVIKNDGLVTGVDATRIKSVARGNSSLW